MRFCAMAFSSVVRTCSCPINSANDWGLYFLAMTWYMKTWLESAKGAPHSVLRDPFESYARPRVIRGTRVKPLPLLPSGPGGVHSHPLHEARSLTTIHANTWRGTGTWDWGLAYGAPRSQTRNPAGNIRAEPLVLFRKCRSHCGFLVRQHEQVSH